MYCMFILAYLTDTFIKSNKHERKYSQNIQIIEHLKFKVSLSLNLPFLERFLEPPHFQCALLTNAILWSLTFNCFICTGHYSGGAPGFRLTFSGLPAQFQAIYWSVCTEQARGERSKCNIRTTQRYSVLSICF